MDSIEYVHAQLIARQAKRDETASIIRDIRKEMVKFTTNDGLKMSCRQANLVWLTDRQQMYPSTHPMRIEARLKALDSFIQSPLPWEADKNWVNPYSTETYSACGYADGLAQERDDAREEYARMMVEWNVSLDLHSGEPLKRE